MCELEFRGSGHRTSLTTSELELDLTEVFVDAEVGHFRIFLGLRPRLSDFTIGTNSGI